MRSARMHDRKRRYGRGPVAWVALGAVVVVAGAACTPVTSYGVGNWPPASWRPYGNTSPFNRAISATPQVESSSVGVVEEMVQVQPAALVAAPGDRRDGGVPIYWPKTSDPFVTLNCTAPPEWGPCEIDGMQVRVPVEAQPAGGYATPDGEYHDAHMTIVDQPTGWEYDLFHVESRTGSTLDFGFGGRTRIDGDGLGSAANAAHFGLLAGPIRAQELDAGVINHALALVAPCTNGQPVYPAAGDGTVCDDGNRPSMGARFQLHMTQAEIDGLRVPGWQKTVLTALRTFGAYVSDTWDGTQWGFEMESPSTYESFDGYRGADNPWARLAARYGIQPEDFNGDGHQERWFYWTADGRWNGPPSIDWHRLRVLQPCSARGTC